MTDQGHPERGNPEGDDLTGDGFGLGRFGDVFLGRHGWDADGWNDDGWDDGPHGDGPDGDASDDRRRTKAVALTGLAVVTALVIVVIVLVGVFVDTSPGPPASPRTAATAWANALVGGDHARQHNLECARGSQAADVIGLVVTGASSADAGPARRRGTDRWAVPVAFNNADGTPQTSLSVTVLRERNRYVVC